MCLPVLGAVVGIASAVVGFAAKQQQYDKDVKQYNQNVQNSLAAGRDDQKQIAARQLQEQQAYHQKDHVANVEAAQKSSEVSVAAASAGVGGLSVGNLLGDIASKTALNRGTLETNYMNTAAQLQAQNDAGTSKTQSRINSMPVPTAPNPASLFVDVAGAGVKAFSG